VHAIVLDAVTVAYVDITAARMLARLSDDLDRRGVRLLIARDIGQVRDVLRTIGVDERLTQVHPTVQSAIDAVT
jgi:anti-anti-sigma regulatory factor